jgi:hypothetical protein
MRTLTLALSILLFGVGFTACGNDGGLTLPDLSGRDMAIGGDMSVALTGCRGLFSCYGRASTDDDLLACEDHATGDALDLANAYFECLGAECLQGTNADTGMPYCSSGSDTGMICSSCIQRSQAGACKPDRDACLANRP